MKIKTLLLAATAACALATAVQAKQFDLPEANPAVTVMLPDKWKPQDVDKGVSATSPDGETFVSIETATAKSMSGLIDDDIKFLTEQGVVIDKATQQTHDTTINGMSVSFLTWKGKDKDGPTSVTLGIYGVSDNLIVLLTAWSSPAGDKLYGDTLTSITTGIKKK